MKKLFIIAVGLVLGMFLVSPAVFAQTSGSQAFTISAEVPVAGAASFAVNKVTEDAGIGGEDLWEEVTDYNLNLGMLGLDTVNNIFVPGHYFVIDVGSDGVGQADLSYEYINTGSPATATAELGDRGTISFAKMTYGVVTPEDITGMSLDQVNSYTTDGDAFNPGQWLRISVGTATGDAALTEGDAEPFTAQDAAGPYSGQLTIDWLFD